MAGPYYDKPNLANAGKDATISALGETTKLLGDQIKKGVEYCVVQGPIEILVELMTDGIEE